MSNNLVVIEGRTITNSEIIDALEYKEGCIVEAAEHLGIKRYDLEDALNADPFLNKVYINIIEGFVDLAQKNVFQAVKGGNANLSIWLLERIGKERGYSTKAELTLVKAERSLEDMSEEELDERILEGAKRIEEDRKNQAELKARAGKSQAALLPGSTAGS